MYNYMALSETQTNLVMLRIFEFYPNLCNLKIILDSFYVYESFACMYICTVCVCSAIGSYKMALGLLELELWMQFSFYVRAGNSTWDPYKSYKIY